MASRASEERPHRQAIGVTEEDLEQRPFITPISVSRPRCANKSRTSVFNKVMGMVNLALGIILATSIGLIAHESTQSSQNAVTQPVEPYSPALEAIFPVIKKFKPDPIFQSETSSVVEAAWKKIEGANGGVVTLSPEESAKLSKASHESVASELEPGKHLYSISMSQQLQCLNTIRKSFYRGKFYAALTDKTFQVRKNDCFDFLRQAIQCHGDVSMTYFRDNNQTSWRGVRESPSDWIGNNVVEARMEGTRAFWDVEHSCRALQPIENWLVARQLGAQHRDGY